jgi:hypothetical protein
VIYFNIPDLDTKRGTCPFSGNMSRAGFSCLFLMHISAVKRSKIIFANKMIFALNS